MARKRGCLGPGIWGVETVASGGDGRQGRQGIERPIALGNREEYARSSAEGQTQFNCKEGRIVMSLFSRKPKVSAPTPVPQATANVQYPHAPIVIQPSAMTLPTGAHYTLTVQRILDEINAFPVGQNFFAALTAAGKQIGVKYGGPNNNQAAGGPRGYVLLRMRHDSGNAAGFGQELQITLQNMQRAAGHDINWLAHQLYSTSLPLWSGGTRSSPFRQLPPMPAGPPRPGGRALPMTPPQRIVHEVNQWIAGARLPSRDEVDVLLLVLRDWVNPGPGVVTRVDFDPLKTVAAGVNRAPHIALFHELVHAYYNALGRQLGREDSLNENNGGRLFELMSVGLGPFATAPFSENAFRAVFPGAHGLRLHYP